MCDVLCYPTDVCARWGDKVDGRYIRERWSGCMQLPESSRITHPRSASLSGCSRFRPFSSRTYATSLPVPGDPARADSLPIHPCSAHPESKPSRQGDRSSLSQTARDRYGSRSHLGCSPAFEAEFQHSMRWRVVVR